jgi:hypothetical protein
MEALLLFAGGIATGVVGVVGVGIALTIRERRRLAARAREEAEASDRYEAERDAAERASIMPAGPGAPKEVH